MGIAAVGIGKKACFQAETVKNQAHSLVKICFAGGISQAVRQNPVKQFVFKTS